MVRNEMKIPIFHGNNIDDPEKYCFLCEAIRTTRQTVDDDVKKSQLETTLMGHALDWYMRFMLVPQGAIVKTLDEICKGLFEEFKKLKSEAQYIAELKEIKQFPTLLHFDQKSDGRHVGFSTLPCRMYDTLVFFEASKTCHRLSDT